MSALLLSSATARAGFVYETPAEFLTSADFNGDGIADVLVLDKITGNARVGYGSTSGALTWSAPLVTGCQNVTGCAAGRFLQVSRDAVAVAAPDFNRINLADLSGTNSAGAPVPVTPAGLGPHTLVALANPFGGLFPVYNYLLAASSFNSSPAERLDLLSISAGNSAPAGQFAEIGPFDRGNALQLSIQTGTFAAGIVRGTNDALHVWQFTNAPNVAITLSNLPPGSDYTFGLFNAETLPRFIFYVPGQSNLTVVSLLQTNGGLAFGPPLTVALSEAVQGVFYLDLGTGGSALIQFGDGIQGLGLPVGTPVLTGKYSSGGGADGNVFTGIVPLGNGRLALLEAPPGSPTSVHAQTLHFNGTNFTQLSSSNLPAISARNTRADVWLFQAEPFVNRSPGFIGSINDPDWSDTIVGLAGTVSATTSSDGGTSAGLGNIVTNNLGATPAGAAFALPNQYQDVISLFSYSAPQPPEAVVVTISPQPGIYGSPIQVSFSTLNASDKVFYSSGGADAWHLYSAPFGLTNDSTIEYYGTNSISAQRSHLQVAAYSLGHNAQPVSTLNLTNGTSSTNPPIHVIPTPPLVLSPLGTIFYGRRSTANDYTIWAINYDGSGDTFVTVGARPRVSSDGHYLAFLRGGTPLVTEGNAWVRDLRTDQENLLYTNSNYTIGYCWDLTATNLIFDWSCWLWKITPGGVGSLLPLATDCYDDAPYVNPVNGRLAFHNLSPNAAIAGLYVTTPAITNKQRLKISVPGASWPAWSPNGQLIAFADNDTNQAFTADGGTNLWVVNGNGTGLNQITSLTDGTTRFPHGAIWSPHGDALVAAGTIYGTNGLWIIPLGPNGECCQGAPILLPTTPGDAIDFAGSVIVAPSTNLLGLFIRLDTNDVVVYWSTNFSGYVLESKPKVGPAGVWTNVPGPYILNGLNFEHHEPRNALAPTKFFRLHYTGAVLVRPQLLVTIQGSDAVISWSTYFGGYTLQAAGSLSPAAFWETLPGPYQTAGGSFLYFDPLTGSGPRFYRLRSQ